MRIVGQFLDGADALLKAVQLRPDIVIIDLSLPDMTGVEVMRRIRDESPDSRIIAYTMHEGQEFVRGAISAGAEGYVLKSSPMRILIRGINQVSNGRSFFDPTIPRRSRSDKWGKKKSDSDARSNEPCGPKNHNLTKRELQMLKMLAAGMTNKMIAAEFSISYNTVSNHVRHIHEKLHVNTRGALVARALFDKLL